MLEPTLLCGRRCDAEPAAHTLRRPPRAAKLARSPTHWSQPPDSHRSARHQSLHPRVGGGAEHSLRAGAAVLAGRTARDLLHLLGAPRDGGRQDGALCVPDSHLGAYALSLHSLGPRRSRLAAPDSAPAPHPRAEAAPPQTTALAAAPPAWLPACRRRRRPPSPPPARPHRRPPASTRSPAARCPPPPRGQPAPLPSSSAPLPRRTRRRTCRRAARSQSTPT